LPELETIDEERRLYPRDGFAAHLIGYVGEVSEDDLNNSRFAYYEPGDVVGKAGIEETYDELLRGKDGAVKWWSTATAARWVISELSMPCRARP